jgi:hypothetical protein
VGVREYFRHVFPAVARAGLTVVDESHHLLTMRHDLYRYVETEIFVPARHVRQAALFVEWVLRRGGGESPPLPQLLKADMFGDDLNGGLDALAGRYVHDHPVAFRRVMADDTMISMSSGDTACWYAISLATYQREHPAFLTLVRVLTRALATAYGGRPHWGKLCPLTAIEIAPLYPELPRFRAHCASVDPQQTFVNDFARERLGF